MFIIVSNLIQILFICKIEKRLMKMSLTIVAIDIISRLSRSFERVKFCPLSYSRRSSSRNLAERFFERSRADSLIYTWTNFFSTSASLATQHLVACNTSLLATPRCLQHLVACNTSLLATPRCLQHLVVCNTSLLATPRCLQHLVACKTSLLATSRCLQHLVVCNQLRSVKQLTSAFFIHILISRCERLA